MSPVSKQASKPQADWRPKEGALMTRWAKDVSPTNVHPEYPRPQLVRKDWMSLNGLWDLEIRQAPGPGPDVRGSAGFKGKILVPFPVESALSGVMKPVALADELVYRRTFKIPAKWKGKRVLLHFGAIDWSATVHVNEKQVGSHVGGYDPFSFDITDALKKSGEQSIVVEARDPTSDGTQPHGKQVMKPEGIWYTPTSGIWQTVWLEPVPETFIERLEVWTESNLVFIQPHVRGPKSEFHVKILDGAKVVAEASGQSDTPIAYALDPYKTWSPEHPFLYLLSVELRSTGKGPAMDSINTYFAFRTISLGKDERGRTRIFLNNKPYFVIGPLDQGFWPDGLYTAPTDAALKYDIEITKKLGFNFIRKHVKVEPERWYYWCDKLGILVFQDIPSGDKYIGGNDPDITRTPESGEQFQKELKAMVETHFNHPSIVGWVVFNEGWGQWRTAEMTDFVRKLDPTRLIDSASGWTDRGTGDLHDIHSYPGPDSPNTEPNRAAFLGEFGGLGLPMPGHMWQKSGWGYRSYKNQAELTEAIVDVFEKLKPLMKDKGLSGAVYTQTTDVETELNGLMTYDRALIKPDANRLSKVIKSLKLRD